MNRVVSRYKFRNLCGQRESARRVQQRIRYLLPRIKIEYVMEATYSTSDAHDISLSLPLEIAPECAK